MARITVEDCLEHVDNRFDLVLLATKRARQLAKGVEPLIPWQNDKPTVVALREIASGVVNSKVVEESRQQEVRREPTLEEQLAAELAGSAARDLDMDEE